jgi:hypothetical protein
MTAPNSTDDIDELLTGFMNVACDYEAGLNVDLDKEFDKTLAAIQAEVQGQVVKELKALNDPMWSALPTAKPLHKRIEQRISALQQGDK